jgi:hypothetical protein
MEHLLSRLEDQIDLLKSMTVAADTVTTEAVTQAWNDFEDAIALALAGKTYMTQRLSARGFSDQAIRKLLRKASAFDRMAAILQKAESGNADVNEKTQGGDPDQRQHQDRRLRDPQGTGETGD